MESGERPFFPTEIHVTNFNNIPSLHVDLGIFTSVTGKNGSGKTTIADAIFFAITGEMLRKVPVKNAVKIGKKKATVKVVGNQGGKEVIITRTRTSTKQDLSVTIEDTEGIVEISNPDVYLSSIVTATEFRKLYYINGHEIGSFFQGTPAQYSKMIDKLFGIFDLNEAISAVKTNALVRKIDLLSSKEMALQSRKESSMAVETMMAMHSQAISELKTIKSSMPSLKSKLKVQEKNLEKTKNSLAKVEDRYRDALDLLSRKEESRRRKANHDRDISRIKNRMVAFKNAIEKIKGEWNIKDRANPDEIIEKDLFSTRSDKSVAAAKLKFWEEVPKLMESLISSSEKGNSCPLCLAPGKKDSAQKNLENMMKSRDDKIDNFKARTDDLRSRENTLEKIRNKLKSLITNINRMQLEAGTMELQAKELDSEIAGIKIEKDVVSTIKMEKEQLTRMMQDETESLARNRYDLESMERRKVDLEKETERFASMKRKSVTWTRVDDEKLEKTTALKKAAEGRKADLVRLKEGMKNVLSMMRSRFMVEVNPKIINMIRSLSNETSRITSFNLVPKVTKKKDELYYSYNIAVEIDGNAIPFSSLSTGEKAISLFSVIMSILDMSNTFSFLVFDEIDASGIDDFDMNDGTGSLILDQVADMVGLVSILFISRKTPIIEYVNKVVDERGISRVLIDLGGNEWSPSISTVHDNIQEKV
jgi:DNA repair exonuclease SbcCD ATPase subunit